MSPAEQKMVDALKANLKSCQRFQCASCLVAKKPGEALGVFLWKPDSKMMKRAAQNRIAPYVICDECGRKPEKETRPLIEATLAKKGLFG
jgi:hypothetical protein